MTPSNAAANERAGEIPSVLATLASYEGFFGPYHPQTLALTLALAVALCASGSAVDGRRLLERAVADLTRHHGKHHPVRVRALEELATLLCREANWTAALPVQQELLECPASCWDVSIRTPWRCGTIFRRRFGR